MIIVLFISIFLALAGAAAPIAAGNPTYKIKKSDVELLSSDMQEIFAGTQYLMNPFQIRHFLSLATEEDHIEWINRFWQLNDPTPTTPENERREEHLVRVKLAKKFFPSRKWPGWDKRGEVLIRYGPPDYRGKIWGEVTIKKMRPPGELWYFQRHDMLIAFQQFGLNDEYIYAINGTGIWNDLSPDLIEFLLYDTSEGLAQKFPLDMMESYEPVAFDEGYQKLGDPIAEANYLQAQAPNLPENIDAIMDPNVQRSMPKDISDVFQRDKIMEVANNFEIVLEDIPASYPFNFNRKELPFYFGVDQFRSGDDHNRVDINLELPVVFEGGSSFEETYHAEVVIWNSEFEEVARKQRDIVLKTAPDVDDFANLVPTQLVLSLEKGYYRMAVSVRGENSGSESSYKTSFTCRTFGPELELSDILFARRIAQSERSSIFSRGALEVIPHPVRAYGRSIAIPLYFEIYNLTLDERGVSSYTIGYQVIPHSKKKKHIWDRFDDALPIVSSRFESSGYSENETRYINVGTHNLSQGSFDILVTITDNLSGDVTFRKGTFSIVE